MLKIFTIIVLSLILIVPGKAQSADTVRKYLDAELRLTNRNKAVYAAVVINLQDHWALVSVYPDTNLLLKIFYKDPGLLIKDGAYKIYHRANVPAQDGYFSNNIMEGIWKTRYENGQVKDSGLLASNKYVGLWKHWYENGQLQSITEYGDAVPDTAAVAVIKTPYKKETVLNNIIPTGNLHGAFSSWYKNGQKEAAGQYQNGTMVGLWTWYRENGQLSTKETYAKGKVIALECYNENGELSGSTCSILKAPAFIHPFLNAQDYIVDELHKRKNKDIYEEGVAELSFVINKNGELVNLSIKNSPDSALSRHITDIIRKMPKWSPAVTHNRVIDFPLQLSIPFFRNPED
jgi:antitoxin component YwqK of YwqJK toxin-antitoxin module